MTSVTVQLSDQEIKTLTARTGEGNAEAALKAWVVRANPKRSSTALRAALKQSLKEVTAPVRGNASEAAVRRSGGSRADYSAALHARLPYCAKTCGIRSRDA